MNWLNHLSDGLLPSSCVLCGALVSAREGSVCGLCSALVGDQFVRFAAPPSVVEGVSLGPYHGIVGQLIREAKYNKNLPLADQLGRWLGRSISSWVDVDLVVPISIPMVRRVVRGFDQGHRIGLGVAAETGIVCSNHLKRRWGPRQVGKSGAERRKLPLYTFSSRGTLDGERILLVDDVVTTGATIHAAARVLKRCGASHIWVATVAHQGL